MGITIHKVGAGFTATVPASLDYARLEIAQPLPMVDLYWALADHGCHRVEIYDAIDAVDPGFTARNPDFPRMDRYRLRKLLMREGFPAEALAVGEHGARGTDVSLTHEGESWVVRTFRRGRETSAVDHRTEHEACAALEDAVRERWPKELLARHRRSPAHLQPFVGRTIDSVDLGGDGIAIVSGDAQFKCLRLPDVHVGGVRLRPKSEEWFLALWGLIGGCVDAFEERGALVAMDVSGTEVVVDTEDPEHDSVEYALVWGPDGGLSVY